MPSQTPRRLVTKISSQWTNGRVVERVGYIVAALLLLSGAAHLLVYAIDGGPWTGPTSWRKPVTFGLSFGIVVATITWISTYLTIKEGTRRFLLTAFTLASGIEVTGITIQAWRGLPSHFNDQDPLSTIIAFGFLAPGGGVLIAILATFTIASFRRTSKIPASMRLAIRAGLVILMIAMTTGAIMIATGVTTSRTDNVTTAYATAGWLKPSHAVTMHAITVLPALALFVSCLDRTETWRTRIITAATGAYTLAAIITIAINVAY